MASLQPTRSLHQNVRLILWLLIIALAFLLRVAPIRAGLPYLRYIDEGHLLHNAITMLQRQKFDTGFYNYPALPSYLAAGALLIYAPFYAHAHGSSFWSDLHLGEDAKYYDFLAPPDVIVVGRIVVLLFSIGIVLLAGILGNAIGGKRTGLLSLLLAAICPALVSRGSIVITDTIATFFAMASLYFAQRLWLKAAENNRSLWRLATAASVAAGLAFVSKYTAGAVLIAVILTILLLRQQPIAKLQLLCLSVLVFVATSLATMPAFFMHRAKVVGTVVGIAHFYDAFPPGPGYFRAAIAPEEMGIFLIVVSLAGIFLMLWRTGVSRSAALSWIVFALVLVTALVRHSFQPFRNFLLLVPPLCVSAAFLITHLHLLATQARARQILARWFAPAAALALIVSLFLPAWKGVQRQRKVVDSRVRAIDWLGKHYAASDRVLVIRELAIHPAEWKRIGRAPTLVSWFDAATLLDHESFDRVIDSDFDPRFANDKKSWSDNRDRWNAEVAPLRVVKTFGKTPCFLEPGVWRSNDERIIIRRGTNR